MEKEHWYCDTCAYGLTGPFNKIQQYIDQHESEYPDHQMREGNNA